MCHTFKATLPDGKRFILSASTPESAQNLRCGLLLIQADFVELAATTISESLKMTPAHEAWSRLFGEKCNARGARDSGDVIQKRRFKACSASGASSSIRSVTRILLDALSFSHCLV
jgi:hypothetical protein